MKYHFESIANGRLERGVTIVTILNGEAEIDNNDTEAALLAEQHGGVLVASEKPRPAQAEARERTKKGGINDGS